MNLIASGIRKLAFAILVFLSMIGFTKQVLASGDSGCSPTWRLAHHDYEGCSNMAFLSPSNDTRVNLLLIMADLRSAKPGATLNTSAPARLDAPLFLWESIADRLGSQADKALLRNNSVASPATPPSDDSFSIAVRADNTLKPEERDALLAARKSNSAVAEKVTKTASAKAYALYLEGAAEFLQSNYDKAAATFVLLSNAQPAWVRETATYMVARALINRAQVGAFDEYGSFSKDWRADATTVTEAEAALDKYLKQYPKGAYSQSARGLKRRGYWLAQDTGKLEEDYGALMLLSPEERNISDVELAQEIDNKLTTLPGTYGDPRDRASEDALLRGAKSPLLLAMLDLLAMRTPEAAGAGSNSEMSHGDPISLSALQQQKPYFASQMPLYEYLLAVHAFYIEN